MSPASHLVSQTFGSWDPHGNSRFGAVAVAEPCVVGVVVFATVGVALAVLLPSAAGFEQPTFTTKSPAIAAAMIRVRMAETIGAHCAEAHRDLCALTPVLGRVGFGPP